MAVKDNNSELQPNRKPDNREKNPTITYPQKESKKGPWIVAVAVVVLVIILALI